MFLQGNSHLGGLSAPGVWMAFVDLLGCKDRTLPAVWPVKMQSQRLWSARDAHLEEQVPVGAGTQCVLTGELALGRLVPVQGVQRWWRPVWLNICSLKQRARQCPPTWLAATALFICSTSLLSPSTTDASGAADMPQHP
jgi:hypothetical protein